MSQPPVNINVATDYSSDPYSGFVIVRLVAGSPIANHDKLAELDAQGIAALLGEYQVAETQRLIREQTMDEILEIEGQAADANMALPNSLTLYWRIDARKLGDRADEFVERLNRLPVVDRAYRELSVGEPSSAPPVNDPLSTEQVYLNAAPLGMDVRWVWDNKSTTPTTIRFVDLERGWHDQHQDLAPKNPSLLLGDNINDDGVRSHGAAVLGIAVAAENAKGVIGIAPLIPEVRLASHHDAASGASVSVASLILSLIPLMNKGDVLLLEVELKNGGPVELDDSMFNAIRAAAAKGIIVVEPAGNGGRDLDIEQVDGNLVLKRGDTDFRESYAILVGAAEPNLPHVRWDSGPPGRSSFGSRVDCYGWGRGIVTCGYSSHPHSGGTVNTNYANNFGGTSGASAMIAGAALLVQSVHQAEGSTLLGPLQMRSKLTTGTPHGGVNSENIGVMPDLRAILS